MLVATYHKYFKEVVIIIQRIKVSLLKECDYSSETKLTLCFNVEHWS